jgi:TonB family protein
MLVNETFAWQSDEIIVSPDVANAGKTFDLLSILSVIYFAGLTFFALRITIQVVSILSIVRNARKENCFGTKVLVSDRTEAPFSFFGYIVIDAGQYTESEFYEIIRHEETHVRQIHSLDALLSEVLCAFAWFNPCVWMLKKEMRLNLEYLADHAVLLSGCEARHYQLNLLKLTCNNQFTISNNFNLSPLKNRIIMMTKIKTSRKSIWKYSLLVPISALLIGTNCVTTTKEYDEIFTVVDEQPQFPGGMEAMYKFLRENITYPTIAQENGIKGQVFLKFVVNKEGTVSQVTVVKGVDPSLDKEASRVVELMPKWTPGKQNGKEVSVWYNLPITFSLGQ